MHDPLGPFDPINNPHDQEPPEEIYWEHEMREPSEDLTTVPYLFTSIDGGEFGLDFIAEGEQKTGEDETGYWMVGHDRPVHLAFRGENAVDIFLTIPDFKKLCKMFLRFDEQRCS